MIRSTIRRSMTARPILRTAQAALLTQPGARPDESRGMSRSAIVEPRALPIIGFSLLRKNLDRYAAPDNKPQPAGLGGANRLRLRRGWHPLVWRPWSRSGCFPGSRAETRR